ncbi:MAG: hypothetical protein AUF64_01825 [Chloroflexi bacterium 13_1_20CM_54_36]|nr:MAG: hypothetical protein AUF64_01825 [Chloroflexi bacterium 13_1_20CM_54_36]
MPGLLHHIEIQLQRGMRIQAKQLMFTEQMTVRRSRRIKIGEQAAQQRQGVAQGRARTLGLTVGPQQGGQFAAGMHAALDRQVEQQGLRLAQGKGEAMVMMKHFWGAEHAHT